tara:strand:+ start:11252 stop:13765 length:2514 start_codon:yes stop_codon:yes gene_type:complete
MVSITLVINIIIVGVVATVLGIGWHFFAKIIGGIDNLIPNAPYASKKGPCGSKKQGGMVKKQECLKAQINYCMGINGGGQNPACFVQRSGKECKTADHDCIDPVTKKKVKCPCWPDDFPCAAFGTFNTDFGLCGTERQGGKKCEKECSASQFTYCIDSGTPDPYQCAVQQRGARVCKGENDTDCFPNSYPCNKFSFNVVPKDSTTYCGTIKQGGKKCEKACIAKQVEYCANVPDATAQKQCFLDRGFKICKPGDKSSTDCWPNIVPCGAFSYNISPTDPTTKCGQDKQGGERCLTQCSAKQIDYCNNQTMTKDIYKCAVTDRGAKVCKDKNDKSCFPNDVDCSKLDYSITPVKHKFLDAHGNATFPIDGVARVNMQPLRMKGDCGTISKGGKKCETQCVDAQVKSCVAASTPNAYDCMVRDRGIRLCKDAKDTNCFPNSYRKGDGNTSLQGCEALSYTVAKKNHTPQWNNPLQRFTQPLQVDGDCGTDRQGGSICNSKCVEAQVKYCKGSGTSDPFKCMVQDRGVKVCPNTTTPLSTLTKEEKACFPIAYGGPDGCSAIGGFAVTDTTNNKKKCGTIALGGDRCYDACAKKQLDYCKKTVWIGPDKDNQNPKCLTDRGLKTCETVNQKNCVPNITLGPYDPDPLKTAAQCIQNSRNKSFDVTGTAKDQQCGTVVQGGVRCNVPCAEAQAVYCNTHGGPKNMQCMLDRGIPLCKDEARKLGLKEENLTGCYPNVYTNLRKDPNQAKKCVGSKDPKCGSWERGGNQGCKVFDFSVIPNRTNDPNGQVMCGLPQQGGKKCKTKCCQQQWDVTCKNAMFCDDACKSKCMKERGCASGDYKP